MSQDQAKHAAFTLIELLVVIGIIAILAGLLLPTLGRAKERMRTTKCLGQLRQLGASVYLYADEHDHRLPAAERRPTTPVFSNAPLPRICDLLSNYVAGVTQVFLCPKDKTYFPKEGSSYEWNFTLNGERLERLPLPDGPSLPLLQAPLMNDYDNVHSTSTGDRKNVLFADGHVERL